MGEAKAEAKFETKLEAKPETKRMDAKVDDTGTRAKVEKNPNFTMPESMVEGSVGETKLTETEDPSQDMSNEALLDLFSNPDLIKSLQSVDEPSATPAGE